MPSTDSVHRIVRIDVLRRLIALSLAVVLLLAASPGSPASGRVLDTDLISGSSVSSRSLSISQAPDITGWAGILVDDAGRVLWARDPDVRHAQASITKLMTAVVALEATSTDFPIHVGTEAVSVGQSSSGLRVGDELPLSTMVKALLVASGNDASVAIARSVAGDTDSFAELMNAKAAELGLENTHFKNPHGLDEEGHYTTAADIAVLVRYAMRFPVIAETVALEEFTLDYGNRTALVENTNDLLEKYEGALGVKTGFTNEAGWCLASGAERGGVRLYAVVLGAPDASVRVNDSIRLFDWGFDHYRPFTLAVAGDPLAIVPVTDTLETVVEAVVAEPVVTSILDYDGPVDCKITLMDVVTPVTAGQRVGSVVWTQAGTVLASAELVSDDSIEKVGFFERIGISLTRTWRTVFGGSLVAESRTLVTAPVIVDPSLEKE